MSYAEIVLATVPAAPPTEKNQRATSCPPPISANVPYRVASRLSASAFCRVVEGGLSIAVPPPSVVVQRVVRSNLRLRNSSVLNLTPRVGPLSLLPWRFGGCSTG